MAENFRHYTPEKQKIEEIICSFEYVHALGVHLYLYIYMVNKKGIEYGLLGKLVVK